MLALGCESAPPEEAIELPDSGTATPDTGAQFTPDDTNRRTSNPDTASRVPETLTLDLGGPSDAPSDSGPGDGGSVDSATEDSEPSADSGPETKPVITTCEGHCGIYLEDNPCHCSVLCVGENSCCAGFQEICKCAKDTDCDDGNDCTSDSCNKNNGFCFQQPMKSCCQNDSECPAGDACSTAKCISGTCTKQPMDCNDGIACTLDFCDKGTCTNKTATGQCLIDGKCHKAGDEDPASGGCATCDPAKKTDAWTAKAGKCAIDGQCVASGAANGTASCAICDTAKSTSAWSVKSGNCFIMDKCYASGAVNPASTCQVCDPVASPTAWAGKAGFCSIDGQCVADKAVNAADACQVCDTTKSKVGWTSKAGFCSIEGACVANGKAAAGSGGCKVCDATKPADWTIKAGATCSIGSQCVTGAKCDASGECLGTQKPGCCVKDDDCVNDPSAQPGPCEYAACDIVSGKCVAKPTAGCCSSGVCCDVANNVVQAKGYACGTFAVNNTFECDGNLGYKVAVVYGCDGVSPTKCSSSVQVQGAKTVIKTCGVDEVCVVSGTTLLCKPK